MSGTLLGLQKRLTKAEQKITDVVQRWELAVSGRELRRHPNHAVTMASARNRPV